MYQQSEDNTKAHHLPRQATPFVGREQELAALERRLTDPNCRLLTLVGPGGIGKTRMALAVTAVATPHFPDGTYFVNLQPVRDEEFLITAVADALNIPLSTNEPPLHSICIHLGKKKLLLTLDNFEQLVDAAYILSDLLVGTGVKLLVTSRETLNLQEEWLYPLGGMSYPQNAPAPRELTQFSAIQLFAEGARRVQPHFQLENEIEPVTQICQLVEGMPLALELAAPWLKFMSCGEIAAEIKRSHDFLATRLRNVPERHRSLQAIYNQTWAGLNEQEQEVFQQLAIFRGGFLRDAAKAVTGASLPLLSSLSDKSLLRWEVDEKGNGRYQIHELLRQYGEEKLRTSPQKTAETTAQHARFYADFLGKRLDDLLGGRQSAAMAEIEAELNNVRAAWQWAIRQQDAEMLLQMGMPLNPFYWYQSRYREAANAFTSAANCLESIEQTPEQALILATMLTNQAWFVLIAGSTQKSLKIAKRSQALYERLAQPPVHGLDTDPRLIVGIILQHAENMSESISTLQAALEEAETRPHTVNQQTIHRLLAQTYCRLDRLELAEKHARKAYTLADRQKDLWGKAYTHDTMGRIALAKGDFDTAENQLLAGHKLQHQMRFAQGVGDICSVLADLYIQQQDRKRAGQYAAEGLTSYRDIHVVHGELAMLARLAHVALLGGELDAARQYALEALTLAAGREEDYTDTLLYLTAVAADAFRQVGDAEPAGRWLAFAVGHPLLRGIYRQYAVYFQSQLQPVNAMADRQTAVQTDNAVSLTAIMAEIQTAFLTPFAAKPVKVEEGEGETAVPANQALIDPLTNRELEVLQLIANGLTNRQIANELIISTGTVKYYTSHIYGKLQVSNRTQAVAQARKLGILTS